MSRRSGYDLKDRVLGILLGATGPMRANEIVTSLIGECEGRVYAASVYRALRDLRKAGTVVKDPLLRTYVASLDRG